MDQTTINQNPAPNGTPYAAYVPPASPAGGQSMVFTSGKENKKGINKNVILAGILVLVLAGLVVGFGKARSFLSKASGETCTPQNIREGSITASSAEIVFQTEKPCLAEVSYGISQDGMLLQVPEALASLNHRIRLSPLLPQTTYYYQLKIDGNKIEPVGSFLTGMAAKPTEAVSSARYTFEDFQVQFGTANPTFDIDKNGVVNTRDWLVYQKTSQ